MIFLAYFIWSTGIPSSTKKVAITQNFAVLKAAKLFVGILDFYRKYLLHAARIQTLLNNLLQGSIKSKAPVV